MLADDNPSDVEKVDTGCMWFVDDLVRKVASTENEDIRSCLEKIDDVVQQALADINIHQKLSETEIIARLHGVGAQRGFRAVVYEHMHGFTDVARYLRLYPMDAHRIAAEVNTRIEATRNAWAYMVGFWYR